MVIWLWPCFKAEYYDGIRTTHRRKNMPPVIYIPDVSYPPHFSVTSSYEEHMKGLKELLHSLVKFLHEIIISGKTITSMLRSVSP